MKTKFMLGLFISGLLVSTVLLIGLGMFIITVRGLFSTVTRREHDLRYNRRENGVKVIKMNHAVPWLIASVFLFTSLFLVPDTISAHCDTLSGPVVQAARAALETGNVNRVLIWVQKKDEVEIQKMFQKTMAVRKLNPEAKDLADMYFFETLVRIHRAGEGASYTGLKPADTDLGPAIPCADKALETGKMEKLLKLLTDATKEGLEEHFKNAMAKKDFKVDDVEAGREYVEAYVGYVHYVERLYEAAKRPAVGHYPESKPGAGHDE